MHGQLRIRWEPLNPGDLADELGRGETSAAGNGDELGEVVGDKRGDLSLEAVDPAGDAPAVLDQLHSDPQGRRGRSLSEPLFDSIEPAEAIEGTVRDLEGGIDVVQVPAQTPLDPRSLPHLVLPMIQQLLDVTLDPGQVRLGKIRLPQEA